MKDLKIYPVGYLGYFGLVAGILLIVLAIAVQAAIPEPYGAIFGGFWMYTPGGLLAANGLREAGKPLIGFSGDRIECGKWRSRILIPVSRVEKVVWQQETVLYLHLSRLKEPVRISLSRVSQENRERVAWRFRELNIPQEVV